MEKYGKVILAQSHLENPRSGWQGSKSQNRSSVDAVADCPMYIYRYIDYKLKMHVHVEIHMYICISAYKYGIRVSII